MFIFHRAKYASSWELCLNKLIVYSKDNCHLCHDMEQDLRLWQTRLSFEFEMIEIDADESLLQRYGLVVPVLISDTDEVICFGRLNSEALITYLQQRVAL